MHAIGKAPGKLILFGEHAAVYGHPCLAIPLQRYLTLTLTRSEGPEQQAAVLHQDPRFKRFLQTLPKTYPALRSLSIEIASDIPVGAGFGSSGALCAAFTTAFHAYTSSHTSADPQHLWEKAHALETHFHSTPSGIDTGIAIFGRPAYFERQNSHLPSVMFLDARLPPIVIGAVKRLSDTWTLVSRIRRQKEEDARVDEALKTLGAMAKEAAILLEDSAPCDAKAFGGLATEAHNTLRGLGLSTPELDQILEQAEKLGAWGGKLSGAGGGGAYYVVARGEEHAKELCSRLSLYMEREGIDVVLAPEVLAGSG